MRVRLYLFDSSLYVDKPCLRWVQTHILELYPNTSGKLSISDWLVWSGPSEPFIFCVLRWRQDVLEGISHTVSSSLWNRPTHVLVCFHVFSVRALSSSFAPAACFSALESGVGVLWRGGAGVGVDGEKDSSVINCWSLEEEEERSVKTSRCSSLSFQESFRSVWIRWICWTPQSWLPSWCWRSTWWRQPGSGFVVDGGLSEPRWVNSYCVL